MATGFISRCDAGETLMWADSAQVDADPAKSPRTAHTTVTQLCAAEEAPAVMDTAI